MVGVLDAEEVNSRPSFGTVGSVSVMADWGSGLSAEAVGEISPPVLGGVTVIRPDDEDFGFVVDGPAVPGSEMA